MTALWSGEARSTKPGGAAGGAFFFTRKDRTLPGMVGLFLVARREKPLRPVGP